MGKWYPDDDPADLKELRTQGRVYGWSSICYKNVPFIPFLSVNIVTGKAVYHQSPWHRFSGTGSEEQS